MSGSISLQLHPLTKVGASRKRSALVLPLVLGVDVDEDKDEED